MKNRVVCSRIDCKHNNYNNYCSRKIVSLNTKGICTLYDKANYKTASTISDDINKESTKC